MSSLSYYSRILRAHILPINTTMQMLPKSRPLLLVIMMFNGNDAVDEYNESIVLIVMSHFL